MICRDICRRKGGVAFCRDADILPRDLACDRSIGFRIRTDGCGLGGEKSALLVPNALVILGYLPSFCEYPLAPDKNIVLPLFDSQL